MNTRDLRIISIVVPLLLAACGQADPCANVSGSCVTVTVEGSARNLDQLALSIDGVTRTTPDVAKAFSLPIKLYVKPPGSVPKPGTFSLAVDGLSGGAPVAHTEQSVSLDARGRGSVTITLGALSGDGGPPPDLIGEDLTGADLSGADLATEKCLAIATCTNGDTCCPSGCNHNNDSDCTSVCGNGAVETGEYCDDNNTANGDGCDSTCQFTNKLSIVSGKPGSQSHFDGNGVNARLYSPSGITGDGTNLYIADDNDHTVRKIDMLGNVTTLAGVGGDQGASGNGNDGSFTTARFSSPYDIEYLAGNLYVNDYLGLRKLDLAAKTVTTVAANCATDTGIGSDGTLILFRDKTTSNILAYKPSDGTQSTIATAAALNTAATGWGSVRDITYSKLGTPALGYVIADYKRLMRVATAGATPTLYAGGGAQTCVDNATATSATFTDITRITNNDAFGGPDIFISDQGCKKIRKAPSTGGITTLAGSGAQGFADNATATSATFDAPYGVFPQGGSQYITEFNGGLVRRIYTGVTAYAGSNPNYTNTYAATGAAARYTLVAGIVAADASSAYLAAKNYPSTNLNISGVTVATGAYASIKDVTVGANCVPTAMLLFNSLYVALGDGTIWKIATNGSGGSLLVGTSSLTPLMMDGGFGIAKLSALALATDGTSIYFVDSANTIRKIDLGAMTVTTIAGTAGATDMVDAVGTNAHFEKPQGLAFTGGKLYTADHHCVSGYCAAFVRSIDLSTKAVKTIAGHAAPGLADGIGTAAGIYKVAAIATNGRSLFLAEAIGFDDANSTVLRELELDSNRVSTMIGTRGEWALSPGVGVAAGLNFVQGIAYEPTAGALFVFDGADQALGMIR